jgi:hypothetical protein
MRAVLREGNMQRAPAKAKYDSTTRTPTLPLDRPQPLLVVLPPLRNSRSEFKRRALHAGSTGKRMTHHAIGITKDGAHMDRCEHSLAASCPRRGTSRSSPKCSGRNGQETLNGVPPVSLPTYSPSSCEVSTYIACTLRY